MRILKMREALPDRRRSWTVETTIQGHSIELGFGEYDDGRLGEVWIGTGKPGTLVRGVMGKLSRMISISLQCGASPEMIVYSLREKNDSDDMIDGATEMELSDDIAEWIAAQIEQHYCVPKHETNGHARIGEGDVHPADMVVRKELDHTSNEGITFGLKRGA